MKITTDFTGAESRDVRKARRRAIHDAYFGAGTAAAVGAGVVRANLNTILDTDIGVAEEFGAWGPKLNFLNETENVTPSLVFSGSSVSRYDFHDASKIWQNSGGTTPGVTGQPLGQIDGSGNAGGVASQSTASQRPTWQGRYAEFDGVDDYLDLNAAARDITRNAPGLTMWAAFRPASVAFMTLIGVSTTGATAPRVLLQVLASGALRVTYRRADGDAPTVVDSAAGLVGGGLDHVAVASVDFAVGGADALRVWVNGSLVVSAAISGTGNTSDTSALRGRIGGSLSGAPPTPLMAGRIYRCGLAKRACTSTEAGILTAYLQGAMA